MVNDHLQIGSFLQNGKYKIMRFINSGGFGCTYEAIHTVFETRVAIKEFFVNDFCNRENESYVTVGSRSKCEQFEKLKKKFIDEAKSMHNMHHENIVHVSDVFEENGTAYYVMDFINGISLQDIVTRKGHISEHEAVNYILQISDALKYVHSKNRLHLDIKPGNIMIDESGKAILIDFGASKHYDEETGENTTTLLGINTKGYAPIEQISQSFKTFNAATDIYALGATLYKIITGKTPPDSLLIASGDVEKPVVSTNFSDGVRNAISKAMMPKRNDRPQTIEEFLAILTRPSAGNAYNVEDEATVCEETTLGTNPHYSPINKTPKPIHAEGQKPSFHWNRKWFRIGTLIVITVIIGGLSYIIFGKGNGKTNSDSESIDLTYYTDLSKIAIGDYLYSDGRYTHDLDSSNIANCSGCVYNLTTTQDEKDSGWTHGHIVALKDAKNRKGESIFSWGPVNQSIPNTMDIDDAMKYKDGYWYCLLDSACQSPAISSIEDFDGKNFDVPLPEGSEWYVPTLSDWRDIIVNLGKGSLKTEHNTLACYDNSKVGPILEKKIGCFTKKYGKTIDDYDYSYWTCIQEGIEWTPDGNLPRAWAIYGRNESGNVGNSPTLNKWSVRPVSAF